MDYVCRAVWGMLCADDACIVSRSSQGLANMMEVIVEICRAFALTVSAKKTETMCMPPTRTPRTMMQVEAAGQIYEQVQSFTYRGGALIKTPGISARHSSKCASPLTKVFSCATLSQCSRTGLSQAHGCTRSSDALVSCAVPRLCEARPGGVRRGVWRSVPGGGSTYSIHTGGPRLLQSSPSGS